MGELQVFVEEAKCVDGSLDVLSHPQLQGEQCGKMAVKQEQTFGAQMGSDSQGWADVSRAGSADVFQRPNGVSFPPKWAPARGELSTVNFYWKFHPCVGGSTVTMVEDWGQFAPDVGNLPSLL